MKIYDNEPIYVAVLNTLRDKILAGEYMPGDMLPTEKELCAQFGATRATVRKGLNELENLGFIRSNPGKGCFVTQPEMDKFTITVRDDYPECEIEVLKQRLIMPDENVRRALKLPAGVQAIECSRVMRQNGHPVALDRNYAPYDPARASAEQTAEFVLFSRINAASDQPFAFSNYLNIHADAADEEISSLLECPVGTPLLVVTRFLFGPNNSRRGFGKKCMLFPFGLIRSSCSYLPSPSNIFESELQE